MIRAILPVLGLLTLCAAQSPPCHLMDVDLCVSHLVGFTDERAGPKSESIQYEKQCTAINKADICLRNYTRVCATPTQQQLFGLVFNGLRRVHHDYCRRGSDMRDSYLRHVPCLRSVIRDPLNPCMKDLQVMGEEVTESNWINRINLACCAYHRVGGCMVQQIERSCGGESSDFVKDIFRSLLSRIPDIRCRDFTDRNPVCQLLPPFGSNPRGGKSTSVINKLIRTYTDRS